MDFPLVSALRQKGYNVIYAADDMPAADDTTILQEAVKRSAVLLTKDKDFGEMVIRQRQAAKGIVLIRIEGLNLSHNIDLVVKLLIQYEADLPFSFTVIQEDKIRIRTLE